MGSLVLKNTLGLPLEYHELPEYFDAHNVNEETEHKNALLERLLKKHSVKLCWILRVAQAL